MGLFIAAAILSLVSASDKVDVTQFCMAKCPMTTSLHVDFARQVTPTPLTLLRLPQKQLPKSVFNPNLQPFHCPVTAVHPTDCPMYLKTTPHHHNCCRWAHPTRSCPSQTSGRSSTLSRVLWAVQSARAPSTPRTGCTVRLAT